MTSRRTSIPTTTTLVLSCSIVLSCILVSLNLRQLTIYTRTKSTVMMFGGNQNSSINVVDIDFNDPNLDLIMVHNIKSKNNSSSSSSNKDHNVRKHTIRTAKQLHTQNHKTNSKTITTNKMKDELDSSSAAEATTSQSHKPPSHSQKTTTPKLTIAYAITVTHFNQTKLRQSSNTYLYDRAAVLHQSVRLSHTYGGIDHFLNRRSSSIRSDTTPLGTSTAGSASSSSSSSSGTVASKYDYKMYAFVHPNATDAIPTLTKLGYDCLIKPTPFTLDDIPNPDLRIAQSNSCCGEREYLKLYSYTLVQHPIVVHLDLDYLVLKPMDDLFDVMLMTKTTDETLSANSNNDNTNNYIANSDQWQTLIQDNATMWIGRHDRTLSSSLTRTNTSETASSSFVPYGDDNPPQHGIDFAYTRDYNMVDPYFDDDVKKKPYKYPHQMGVQGGFFVVKPNMNDFHSMVRIIVDQGGDRYTIGDGWGGPKGGSYGGYYGSGTIQGLASYYYGHYWNHTRSLELNRCHYNTMVDNPYRIDPNNSTRKKCRTLQSNDDCEDCRETSLDRIYTMHFTTCGKPEWCQRNNDPKFRLCMQLFQRWHQVRTSIEEEWNHEFQNHIVAGLVGATEATSEEDSVENQKGAANEKTLSSQGKLIDVLGGHCDELGRYIPMVFPTVT